MHIVINFRGCKLEACQMKQAFVYKIEQKFSKEWVPLRNQEACFITANWAIDKYELFLISGVELQRLKLAYLCTHTINMKSGRDQPVTRSTCVPQEVKSDFALKWKGVSWNWHYQG